jgi:DNA polymerase-3 subunit beta
MKISIDKEIFLEKLSYAARFTSSRLSSLTALQGVLIEGKSDKISFYSTNLSSYYHTFVKNSKGEKKENFRILVEPKKIIEFLSFLSPGSLEIEVKEKQITLALGKTKGVFPLLPTEEFPPPPKIEGEEQKIRSEIFLKNLPLVVFAASNDETRPVLTGINFLTQDEEMVIVATDGFRLSMVKIKKEIDIPSMIVPSGFLDEAMRFIKGSEVSFGYSKEEKAIMIKAGENELYSRLIEGEYPPFEKVVPSEKNTTVKIDREETLRNIKAISVFARDFSNIVILEVVKEGIQLKPKIEGVGEDIAYQEAEVKGDEQKIAFNYKFLLDLLNHLDTKEVVIEIVRPDAPVVFKLEDNPNFLHIIMPVRIQE